VSRFEPIERLEQRPNAMCGQRSAAKSRPKSVAEKVWLKKWPKSGRKVDGKSGNQRERETGCNERKKQLRNCVFCGSLHTKSRMDDKLIRQRVAIFPTRPSSHPSKRRLKSVFGSLAVWLFCSSTAFWLFCSLAALFAARQSLAPASPADWLPLRASLGPK